MDEKIYCDMQLNSINGDSVVGSKDVRTFIILLSSFLLYNINPVLNVIITALFIGMCLYFYNRDLIVFVFPLLFFFYQVLAIPFLGGSFF